MDEVQKGGFNKIPTGNKETSRHGSGIGKRKSKNTHKFDTF